LCESGVQAEVVFGEHDEVGLTAAERRIIASCPTTRLHFAPDAGHMLINQQPDWIAELIANAVARYGDQTRQDARSRTARSARR
jgi:pimeloyl-ACP methyl ester carboxylesterase